MAVTYDKNTDYKALMEAAAQAGDYAAAAKYEQQRNAKIQDMNLAGGGTNPYGAAVSTDYAQYLGGGYNAKGSHNDAGLSTAQQDAISNYKAQYYNAMSLNDQAGMDAAHAGAEAIRAAAGYSGGTDGSDYIASGGNTGGFSLSDIAALMSMMQSSQPTYESKYNTQIDQMLNEILNREDFSYDAESDPLYQQYQKQYQREGQRAMNDTLASVASNAGGMNSYAVTAAQQANDYYNAQMTDKIPELYQLAYEMYLQDIDNQVRDLGLVQQMDDTQYNRYRDTMSDWRNDLDFAYGAYRDDVADSKWNQEFQYGALRDAVADSQWNKTFDYNAGRDTVSDQQWREEFEHGKDQDSIANNRTDKNDAYNRAMEYIAMGVMPSADVLTAAGISSSEAQALLDKVQAENEAHERSLDDAKDDTEDTDNQNGYTGDGGGGAKPPEIEEADPWAKVVRDLGVGVMSAETISKIAALGGIVENEDGSLSWANGWDKNNWSEKLKQSSFVATQSNFGYNFNY